MINVDNIFILYLCLNFLLIESLFLSFFYKLQIPFFLKISLDLVLIILKALNLFDKLDDLPLFSLDFTPTSSNFRILISFSIKELTGIKFRFLDFLKEESDLKYDPGPTKVLIIFVLNLSDPIEKF